MNGSDHLQLLLNYETVKHLLRKVVSLIVGKFINKVIMAQTILHLNGAYNIFSSISDAPIFESAIDLRQLKQYINDEFGKSGLRELDRKLKRAKGKGTSSLISDSIEDEIQSNRAGDNESTLPFDEFVKRFLTLE